MPTFILREDKVVSAYNNNSKVVQTTWVEAKAYKVVRHFDDKRIIVETSDRPKQITLLRLADGVIIYD